MENKDRFCAVLKEDNGTLNEIDLGERIGLTEYETMEIIAELLAEYKIEYERNRLCDYRVLKRK